MDHETSPRPSSNRSAVRAAPLLIPWIVLALVPLSGSLTHFGNKWGWSGTGEAFVPQLVMYATPPHFYRNPEKIDRDIATFLVGQGFNGFHVFVTCRWFDLDEEDCRKIPGRDPELDPRTFEALELLIRKTYAAGGMVHLWLWGDEQRGQTPSARPDWGGVSGPVARKLEREIARRLGPLPGWSMGYGFDLDEWVRPEELHDWRNRLQELLPGFHFLGGRPAGPNQGTAHWKYRGWNEGLDYSSFEHHKPTYAVYVSALEASPDKPVLSEDRFRVMPGRDSDSKHYSLEEVRRGLWHSALAGGVGNIWGYLRDGGSHDLGSAPFPNRAQILTYSRFLRGRFLTDMRRCSRADSDPRKTTLCLGSPSGRQVLLYKEDASQVEIPPNVVAEPLSAVAVDAEKPYEEIDAGEIGPETRQWIPPYRSDWALAVGRFEPVVAVSPHAGSRPSFHGRAGSRLSSHSDEPPLARE